MDTRDTAAAATNHLPSLYTYWSTGIRTPACRSKGRVVGVGQAEFSARCSQPNRRRALRRKDTILHGNILLQHHEVCEIFYFRPLSLSRGRGHWFRSSDENETRTISSDLALFPTSINVLFHLCRKTTVPAASRFACARRGWQPVDFCAVYLVPAMVVPLVSLFRSPNRVRAPLWKTPLVLPCSVSRGLQRRDPRPFHIAKSFHRYPKKCGVLFL